MLFSTPSPHTITISWHTPIEPNGQIMQYEVQYTNHRTIYSIMLDNAAHTQYNIEELIPNTNYTIRVRAYTSIGPGQWSNVTASTAEIRKI